MEGGGEGEWIGKSIRRGGGGRAGKAERREVREKRIRKLREKICEGKK